MLQQKAAERLHGIQALYPGMLCMVMSDEIVVGSCRIPWHTGTILYIGMLGIMRRDIILVSS